MCPMERENMTRIFRRDIIWELLIVLTIGMFIDSTYFFVLSFAYLIYILFRRKFSIKIPRLPGLKLYMALTLLNLAWGFFQYSARSVIRDVYYIAPTIIWVFIFSNILNKKNTNDDSFYKTLFLYGFFNSINAFARFILSGNLSFNGLRLSFTEGVYTVGFIATYVVIRYFYCKEYAFSKKTDGAMLLVMGTHIALSLGRVSIGLPLIALFLMPLLLIRKTGSSSTFVKRALPPILLVLIVAVIAISIIPNDVKAFFGGKILKSFTEINTTQVINSTEDAMNNWRAYENQVAIAQWKASFVGNQLFGSGLGAGVKVAYVPYSWKGMLVDHKVPLLHNGYLTALIKLGVLGVIALITMFAVPGYRAIKRIKNSSSLRRICVNIEIVCISLMAILFTYVVRGPIEQAPFIGWALMISYLNACNQYMRDQGKAAVKHAA